MENIVFNYAGPWNNILPLKREQKINILLDSTYQRQSWNSGKLQ